MSRQEIYDTRWPLPVIWGMLGKLYWPTHLGMRRYIVGGLLCGFTCNKTQSANRNKVATDRTVDVDGRLFMTTSAGPVPINAVGRPHRKFQERAEHSCLTAR